MSLDLDVQLDLGALALRVELAALAAAITVLLGPNGAGKSTLLRAVAGHQPVDGGRIALDGTVLDEPATRTFTPPERRGIGVVHQEHLLFPHLTALDNVAFGLRCGDRARTRSEADAEAQAWLDRVGLADVAGAKPGALSGGQSQRVALARALAPGPRALLLDEPLAALDAATRVDVRRTLRRHLTDFAGPVLLVTHDPIDALTLADQVVVLERGEVVQAGTIHEVAVRPRTTFVAELVGTNLLTGDANGTVVDVGGAIVHLADPQHGRVLLTVAPRAVSLHRAEPEGSARNRWPATVAAVELAGDRARVELAGLLPLVAEVTRSAVVDLDLREGDAVWAAVKATEVDCYPAT